MTGERQVHGFNFQKAVQDILGVKDLGYTSKFDIVHDGKDISVKFIGVGNSVDCGSFKRIWQACLNTVETRESWYMILGRHVDYVCTAVYELELTPEVCKAIMGDLPTEEVYGICEIISLKHWPIGHHNEAREVAEQWKAEWKHLFGKISPARKIDSKKQRRMQCTINKTHLNSLFDLVPSKTFESLVGKNFKS